MIHELTDLIRKADEAVLKVYDAADFGVEYKEDDSPLTEADRVSNSIIIEGLRGIAPDIPVISEENAEVPYGERKKWKRFWLVDPLDGTKEFIKRNGEFTINIALIEEGDPVLGMISVPVQRKICYGSSGKGAFCVCDPGEKARSISVSTADRNPVAVVSRSHLSEKTAKLIRILDAETIGAGSALKFTLVAGGEADIYPRLGPTWEWDTGAGHAIAEAAGAVVCGLGGQSLVYNKEKLKHDGFLVCVPALKDRVLAEIRKVI
ncbi:MAG: 3'(2'),5'-bisphosphate nucleotidase CysQ [Candidatus Omnitrophota bacterium]|nr:3'(2'),5'-bisphosphate nucleotidase CysQ [Candidatus Omnitrophota bacterium]